MFFTASDEDASIRGLRIARLDLEPVKNGIRLSTFGSLQLERGVPFTAMFTYDAEDRIRGGARLLFTDSTRARTDPLLITAVGSLHQDFRRGLVTIGNGTRVTIGQIPLWIEGKLASRGPALDLAVRADDLTEERIKLSLPPAVLGPLLHVGVRGSWDHRVALDLDLARPDSVRFEADVVPHHLMLDPARTSIRLPGLDKPFVAVILLPRGARSVRELSPNNPHFRTLDMISPDLVHAVVTNEDGGFFGHHGFNVEAMKQAIAENLKAGTFRRGAGTITMQLARNLYTGHARTLSRKGQEIVLAWILEHAGLATAIAQESTVTLRDIPGFQQFNWDRVFFFGPYTPRDAVERKAEERPESEGRNANCRVRCNLSLCVFAGQVSNGKNNYCGKRTKHGIRLVKLKIMGKTACASYELGSRNG